MNSTKTKFKSLLDVINAFPTERHCREYIEKLRWNGKIVCPKCGSDKKIYKMREGKLYKCSACRKQFTIRVGTIFEDSPLPLQKWILAMYLITAHKKGISSHQLSRDIDVTQETAWFMLHRIRYAIQNESFNLPLKGKIEIDETYYGGEPKNKHVDKKVKRASGYYQSTKKPILGMRERDGKVVARVIPQTRNKYVRPIIHETIKRGSYIFTDEHRVYEAFNSNYKHLTVNHSAKEYVNGMVHTNGIENFWSHLKRGLNGINHWVSVPHLQAYVNEYAFRYNTRKITDIERFNDALGNISGRLTYKDLKNKSL